MMKKSQKSSRVRVIGFDSKGTKIGEDRSDNTFSILGVRLTAPREGTTLKSGTTSTITWEAMGTLGPVSNVKLYVTKNGGANWSLITTVAGNPGSCDWSVPFVNGIKNKCKLRVILRDSKKNTIATDFSDGYFTIEPSP